MSQGGLREEIIEINNMIHSLEKDRKYLIWNNQRGIAHVVSRGYHWLKDKYLPAIKRIEEADMNKDRYLLNDCYYMIGDIHDFNDCPKAAIKAYKRSFEFASDNAAALREMGNMYERIGQYKKAVSVLRKSLQIDPDNEFAISDYEDAIDSGGTPLYQKKDVCWQAREYLAQDKPNSALRLLDKKRSIPALQINACAYGMLNNTGASIEQWHKIASAKGTVEMTYADWFYMTDSVWNNTAFWELIAQCAKQNRFVYGIWYMNPSLWEKVIPFPKHRKTQSNTDLKRCNRRSFLLAQYHITRINHDLKLASKLFKRYPKWLEVEKLYKKLC